jgi:phage protein D
MGMRLSREVMLAPAYSIHLGGEKLHAKYLKYVTSVEVTENSTEASGARISVSDIDHVFLNWDGINSGKLPIKVYLGFRDHYRLMLDGVVSHLEGDFGEDGIPNIVICATDKTNTMADKKRSRKWKKVKSSTIVKQIAKEYGLKCSVQETEDTIDEVTQESESDASLIARLADDEGFIFFYSSSKKEIYYGERFSGLTSEGDLYYNSGDFTVQSFQPTLVAKAKATSDSESGVSDSSGKTVTKNKEDGDPADSSSEQSKKTSKSGADKKYTVSEYTGKVTQNKSKK